MNDYKRAFIRAYESTQEGNSLDYTDMSLIADDLELDLTYGNDWIKLEDSGATEPDTESLQRQLVFERYEKRQNFEYAFDYGDALRRIIKDPDNAKAIAEKVLAPGFAAGTDLIVLEDSGAPS